MIVKVSHAIFMKKQPFLDFLCEVMLQSPCSKWRYGRNRDVQKIQMKDVMKFLDGNISGGYYHGEILLP
jgi:hypothetical protein